MSIFDSMIEPLEQRIAALTQQLADMTADRDSEHRWAERYFREKQAAEKERDAAVELAKRQSVEIYDAHNVIVAALPVGAPDSPPLAPRIAYIVSQRDSALALARQAVEVLETVAGLLNAPPLGSIHDFVQLQELMTASVDGAKREAIAFLSRPEVKALGGGK